jgi:hypothetical protein
MMSLIDLVEHYEFCLLSIRRCEVELDGISLNFVKFTYRGADLFEKLDARIFTPALFPKVREQVRRLPKWDVTKVTWVNGSMRCEVTLKEKDDRHVHVTCTFQGSLMVNMACQCCMMESEDIPCGHIFYVLRFVQLETIPPCCIAGRWTKDAKKSFPTELGTNTLVWSEQMDRFHALRNKGNCAMFKASKSSVETERIMRFFNDIIAQEDCQDGNPDGMTFAPVLAHFSSAPRHFTTVVKDPMKKISKGAPSKKKRWKPYVESWRTN